MTSTTEGRHQRAQSQIQHVSTVLLALAAVATAWAGYQGAQLHGDQAEAQSRATAKRLESTRASGVANRQIQVDVEVFSQWVDARGRGEAKLAAFYRERFTDRFKPAFRAWIATRPFESPNAPETPFEMPEYKLELIARAEQLEAEAAAATEVAKEDIRRADDYVLATVLFAISLFFAGISTRLQTERGEALILGLGCVLFVGTVVWIATLPVSFSA
jgi:hypothetical protein